MTLKTDLNDMFITNAPTVYLAGTTLSECIGISSLAWREIETQVENLIINSSNLLDPILSEDPSNHLKCIFLANMNLRNKIKNAKIIVHQGQKKDSKKLFATTEKLLNYIDGELRTQRNRFIHDQWGTAPSIYKDGQKIKETEFVAIEQKASIIKPCLL